MNDGHLQIGYHGCDVTVRDALVSGRLSPESSDNQYDWLGPGFYMFEGDADRALAFAEAADDQPQRRLTARPIATPAVVGCIFSVHRCLDMTTKAGRLEFENAYLLLHARRIVTGEQVPMNAAANSGDNEMLLRGLDRAVFQFIHAKRAGTHSSEHYQAVRGAFRQGPEIAPSSGFHRDSHVQIALRDFTCIKGWFLPPGEQLLDHAQMAIARAALHAARLNYTKAHRRA